MKVSSDNSLLLVHPDQMYCLCSSPALYTRIYRVCVRCLWQALVGDRYGYRPFPACIDAAEYELLMTVGGLVSDDVDTVNDWYLCDDNAVPPCYVLQVSLNQHLISVSLCVITLLSAVKLLPHYTDKPTWQTWQMFITPGYDTVDLS